MPIEVHPDYPALKQDWDFYAVSDTGGDGYADATDGRGQPMLVRFDDNFETRETYLTRKQLALPPEVGNRIVSMTDWFVRGGQWSVSRDGAAGGAPAGTPRFDAWADNADRQGRPFLEVLHKAGRGAQVFGEWYVGLDAPPVPPDLHGATLSEADTRALGLAPYLTQNDPRDVVDWSRDDATDDLTRVVVKEQTTTKTRLTQKAATLVRFREWFPDGWVLYDDRGRKVAEGPHDWRRVPFWRMTFVDPERGRARSQLQGIAAPQRLLFNVENWLDNELRQSGVTWYAVLSRDHFPQPPRDFPVQANTCVGFRGDAVQRMSGDPAVAQALAARAARLDERILINAHLVHESRALGADASGERVRMDRIGYDQVLLFTARERAEIGNAILAHLARLGHIEPGLRVVPPESFDPRARELLLAEVERVTPLGAVPPHAKRLLLRQWLARRFPHAAPADAERLERELGNEERFAADRPETSA